MLIGFSKHGRGGGKSAVNYLIDGMPSAVGYLTNRTRRGQERNPPPVVVRGNHCLTERLIANVPFKRKYVSGVLSFEERTITPEMEARIIDRFEAVAFAGLDHDRWNTLWVRHTHKGRHEIHFLTPAVDLQSGKNININPPRESTRELFDGVRRLINDEFHLSDPDDPARARGIRVPSYAKGKGNRETLRIGVASFLEAKRSAGLVKNRDDALRTLAYAGYRISRIGERFVTITDSTGTRCRIKGAVFEPNVAGKTLDFRLSPGERTRLETRLCELTEVRRVFNERRYRGPEIEREPPQLTPGLLPEHRKPSHDRVRTPFIERSGTLDGRSCRARSALGAALERGNDTVRRWRSAFEYLERTSRITNDTRERLDRAAHTFGVRASEAISHFKERQLTQDLFGKYGITCGPREDAEKEQEFELERELCEEY